MGKTVAKVWTFVSDSSPGKTYETLQYEDGSTSCNCPGWTRRVAADGSRTCKHTRMVDQGLADGHAMSSHDYNSPVKKATVAPKAKVTEKTTESGFRTPGRRIQWQ